MANDVLETGLAALAFARRVTTALLEDIQDDKLTYQPMAGANHALWIIGHIAVTDEVFLGNVGKRPVKRLGTWKDLFYTGSIPKPSLADYPPAADIRDYFSASREELIAWFKSLSEAELHAPLPEDMQTFGRTPAVLMSTIACHEALHAGQLTVVRKNLGITPRFG